MWKSRGVEDRYARDIRKLISEQITSIKAALESATTVSADGTTYVDTELFQSMVERILKQTFDTTGVAIAESNVKDAMNLGIAYSDRTLGVDKNGGQ